MSLFQFLCWNQALVCALSAFLVMSARLFGWPEYARAAPIGMEALLMAAALMCVHVARKSSK